jgi:putative hydrolase of the HAD superfamily
MNDKSQLLILDLDDTLIDTSHVYWISRARFINALIAKGIDGNILLEMFELQDEKNMQSMGFAPERYEKTMLDVYEHLIFEEKIARDELLAEELRQSGRVLINQLPELITGATELLRWARDRFKLILFTRGTATLQRRKIVNLGIERYFDDIQIVSKKEPADFQRLVNMHGYSPETTWVIGDSIRSDINPALQLGANAILYAYSHHSYYWRQEYGVVPLGSFYKVETLEEAMGVLDKPHDHFLTSPSIWLESLSNAVNEPEKESWKG